MSTQVSANSANRRRRPIHPARRGHIMRWLTRQIKNYSERRQAYRAIHAEAQRLVDQWHEERGVRA